MDGRKLQDRLYLGMGRAAGKVGQSADAFRPSGWSCPLSAQHRFIRLPAMFVSTSGAGSSAGYGNALWHGIFDASYTRPGDYIVGEPGTFFIASQDALLPVLCIKTNRTVSIVRPNVQSQVATNPYGGYKAGGSARLIDRWPASVLGDRAASPTMDLPADAGAPQWSILLPALGNLVLSPGDLVTDDLDRTGIISGTELSSLGWRLSAKMATT